mmetsp:Transcript_28409/g.44337  ORF Transcript_28409/g.44337 Transcript_28409/m.44337 type:complete len:308 (+) Transcript_28409:366-1289(+)
MHLKMNEFRPLLTGHLVSCSIHDCLNDFQSMIGKSILVYFPRTFDSKREQYFLAHPRSRETIARDLNLMYDAVIVRWFNSRTGKFNGHPICAKYKGRTPDADSWGSCMLYGAALCNSSQQPELLLCVAGMEKYYSTDDHLRNIYFRRLPLLRESTFPKRHLVPIRPQVLQKEHLSYDEIQTTLSLDLDVVLTEEEPVPSELLEKCTGLRRRTETARESNIPKQFTPVRKLEVTSIGKGRSGKDRVRFQIEGDWRHPPPQYEDELRKHREWAKLDDDISSETTNVTTNPRHWIQTIRRQDPVSLLHPS